MQTAVQSNRTASFLGGVTRRSPVTNPLPTASCAALRPRFQTGLATQREL